MLKQSPALRLLASRVAERPTLDVGQHKMLKQKTSRVVGQHGMLKQKTSRVVGQHRMLKQKTSRVVGPPGVEA
jgi:hypothetical protein